MASPSVVSAMALSMAHRRAIRDPRSKRAAHTSHRRNEQWHRYRIVKPSFKRSAVSHIPTPEASSKETSPKAQSFREKQHLLQPQQHSSALLPGVLPLPSPPPSDRSDQSGSFVAAASSAPLLQTTARARLQKILAEPIHWVSATQKTLDTEMARTAPQDGRAGSPPLKRAKAPGTGPASREKTGVAKPLSSKPSKTAEGKKIASSAKLSKALKPVDEGEKAPSAERRKPSKTTEGEDAASSVEAARPPKTTEESGEASPIKPPRTNGETDAAQVASPGKTKRHAEQKRKDRVVRDLVKSGRISKALPKGFVHIKRARGLDNPGMYCYRRSVMQAFLQTPVFMTWLESHKAPAECPTGGSECIACAMRALMRAYYGDKPTHKALTQFDRSFNLLWPQTRHITKKSAIRALHHNQQDADEFITGLLDAFCDAPRRDLPMSGETRDALFNMSISHTWHCANPKCTNSVHTTVQSERGLILDIGKPRENLSIKHYIKHHFKGDVLEEVTCDVCETKQRRRPRPMHLLAGPEILVIQLRRFAHFGLGDRSSGRKCLSRVQDIEELDLGFLLPKEYRETSQLSYELKHTVIHKGSSISHGHYVSHCKGPTGAYMCDDGRTMATQNMNKLGGTPYLLVYTRKSVTS